MVERVKLKEKTKKEKSCEDHNWVLFLMEDDISMYYCSKCTMFKGKAHDMLNSEFIKQSRKAREEWKSKIK